jgi:hypothetical protein
VKKNTVLIVVAAGDAFLSPKSIRKINEHKAFETQLKSVIDSHENKSAIVNFHFPNETFLDSNVFSDVQPTKLISTKIHSFSLLSKDNEMTINTHDNDELRFNGDDFSFIFRPDDYDIHIAGIDINGIFNPMLNELLNLGYHVTLYSDASRPFKTNYKMISSLVDKQRRKFRHCSFKSV